MCICIRVCVFEACGLRRPLVFAVEKRDLEAVQILLTHGAYVNFSASVGLRENKVMNG